MRRRLQIDGEKQRDLAQREIRRQSLLVLAHKAQRDVVQQAQGLRRLEFDGHGVRAFAPLL
jgi:hypothetical protein